MRDEFAQPGFFHAPLGVQRRAKFGLLPLQRLGLDALVLLKLRDRAPPAVAVPGKPLRDAREDFWLALVQERRQVPLDRVLDVDAALVHARVGERHARLAPARPAGPLGHAAVDERRALPLDGPALLRGLGRLKRREVGALVGMLLR